MLSKRPWIISLVFIIALSAWLASGSIGRDTARQGESSVEVAEKTALASVRVRTVKAERVDHAIVLYGRTEPNRTVTLLKETQALIARLQRDMENTTIRAPFSGVLLERHAETGDYVSIGDPVADIVDLDPIIVRGDLTQSDVAHLETGQAANIKLVHGEQHRGKIRYLASVSDSKTNTFRVEISVPNPQYQVFGGLSAEIEIPLEQVMAIRISPALLALNDEVKVTAEQQDS